MSESTKKIREIIDLTAKRFEGLAAILDNADLIIDVLSKQRRLLGEPIVIKEPVVPQECKNGSKEDNLTKLQEKLVEVKSELKSMTQKRGRKPKTTPVNIEPKVRKKPGRKIKTEGIVKLPDGSTLAYHTLEERKLAWKIYADVYRKGKRAEKLEQKKRKKEQLKESLTRPTTEENIRWLKEHLDNFHALVKGYPGDLKKAVQEFYGFEPEEEISIVEVTRRVLNNLEEFGLTRNEFSNVVVKEQP